MQDRRLRDRIVRYRADPGLPRDQAAARIAAYVYGNIIVFATTVPLTPDDLHHAHATLLVLGVAASTYLAHVFADIVGHNVRSELPLTRADLGHELRDSWPVLTSGLIPAALLLAGAWHWLPERAAIVTSEVYLLLRMALIGLLVERLRSGRPSARTLLAGVLLAAAAAGVSLVKVAIGH
ncbi:hypothetical protein [Symbioplanes lichenis]|uniref:hypothetical protein n=1 Tax=Symbioplanes lichenis TaxID=1629072 RepID=UPI0027385BB9|nr:hypothetical protein [Actinoplanes lichenis]